MKTTKPRKSGLNHNPSVRYELPLVGNQLARFYPSVCIRIPFVPGRAGGFTLIELIVTLAVAAILITLAVPSLRSALQNNRIITNTNDFISDVNYARSEALKRGTNVGICQVANLQAAMQCDGANWAGDRMIFADTNNDSAFTIGEMVLRTRERLNNNTLTSANAPSPLIISARGLLGNSNVPVIFSLCDDRGASHGRAISINVTGQVSSAQNPGSC